MSRSIATALAIVDPDDVPGRTPEQVAETIADACTTFPEIFKPEAFLGEQHRPKVETHLTGGRGFLAGFVLEVDGQPFGVVVTRIEN